ncbi:hypothetical protein JCM10207_006390 [Rhodosporidiobolus poonsookiae]
MHKLFVLSTLVAGALALTRDQLLAVFPSADGLTGSSAELPRFDLTIVQNSSHALFVVNATDTAPSSIGWLGTGHGTAMSNADFFVSWPTISSNSVNWTISHRLPNTQAPGGHGMPMLASEDASTGSAAFLTLVPALTTSEADSPFSSVAWVGALQPGSSYPAPEGVAANLAAEQTSFVYASSTTSPGSADEGEARIGMHDQPHGTTSLDLASAINAEQDEGVVNQVGGNSRSSRDKMLIAHATLGSLALALITPAAVLLARLGRSIRWFPSHAALNSLSLLLIIIAFALGVSQAGGSFDDFHKRLGLALFLLFLVQPVLGLLGHAYSKPAPLTSAHPSLTRPLPSPVRALHVLLGVTIVTLGYTQIASGINVEWTRGSDARGEVPGAVRVVFWVLVGLEIAAYIAGWAWGAMTKEDPERRGWVRRRSEASSAGDSNGEKPRRGHAVVV